MTIPDILDIVNNSKDTYKIYNDSNDIVVSIEYMVQNKWYPYKITYLCWDDQQLEPSWITSSTTTSAEGLLSNASNWKKHTITNLFS